MTQSDWKFDPAKYEGIEHQMISDGVERYCCWCSADGAAAEENTCAYRTEQTIRSDAPHLLAEVVKLTEENQRLRGLIKRRGEHDRHCSINSPVRCGECAAIDAEFDRVLDEENHNKQFRWKPGKGEQDEQQNEQ